MPTKIKRSLTFSTSHPNHTSLSPSLTLRIQHPFPPPDSFNNNSKEASSRINHHRSNSLTRSQCNKSRPKTAITSRSLHPVKQYRVLDQIQYNQIKNSIHNTFSSSQNKLSKEIKDLTCDSQHNPYLTPTSTSHPKSIASPYLSINKNFIKTEDNLKNKVNSIKTITPTTTQSLNHNQRNRSQKQKISQQQYNNKYSLMIDRLCVKYSISPNPNKTKAIYNNEQVDVDFIAKKYAQSKSKEKQKDCRIKQLKKSIGKISNRYIPNAQEDFFKFDCETLREMQKKYKMQSLIGAGKQEELTATSLRRGNDQLQKHVPKSKSKHPYMQLYQQSQIEAMQAFTQNNTLQSFSYPLNGQHHIFEAQDWEKDYKSKKKLYVDLRKMRKMHLHQGRKEEENHNENSFYITS